ncbi:Asparaginase/glutaminase [Mariannaea sp. PMI_226]|nr:Asparaginase/glutaminase [Mariannaea sp. PMI_226]
MKYFLWLPYIWILCVTAQVAPALPNITIITEGGTVGGKAISREHTAVYNAGVLDIKAIVKDICEPLHSIANINLVDFSNGDSIDRCSFDDLKLIELVTKLLNDPYTNGLVILHGTHTMIETATALSLAIKTEKPIVLTGAARPASALGADGPLNILSAVRVVISNIDNNWATKRGDLVIVFQGQILSPWGTIKSTESFEPGLGSQLGFVMDGEVIFNNLPGTRAPRKFNISPIQEVAKLPQVNIFHAQREFPATAVETVIDEGAKGIILVAYGNGFWPKESAERINTKAENHGVPVVLTKMYQSGYIKNAQSGVGMPGGRFTATEASICLQFLIH